MIEIEVKTVYGDYEIPYQEQEYHDMRVDYFKGQLYTLLKNYPQQIIRRLIVDCEYYPAKRKFKITSVTREHKTRLDYTLNTNPQFVREFLSH